MYYTSIKLSLLTIVSLPGRSRLLLNILLIVVSDCGNMVINLEI